MTAKHLTKSITRDIIIVCSEQLSAFVNIHGEHDVTASKPVISEFGFWFGPNSKQNSKLKGDRWSLPALCCTFLSLSQTLKDRFSADIR